MRQPLRRRGLPRDRLRRRHRRGRLGQSGCDRSPQHGHRFAQQRHFPPGPPDALLRRGQPCRALHPQPGSRGLLDRQHQDELRQRHDLRAQRRPRGGQPEHRLRPRRLGALGRHQHRPRRLRGQHVRQQQGGRHLRRVRHGRHAGVLQHVLSQRPRDHLPAVATRRVHAEPRAREPRQRPGRRGSATRPTPPPIMSSPTTSSAIAVRPSGSPSSSRISPTTTSTGRERIRPLPGAKRPKTARRRSTRNSPRGQRPPATTGTARFSTPSRRTSASTR